MPVGLDDGVGGIAVIDDVESSITVYVFQVSSQDLLLSTSCYDDTQTQTHTQTHTHTQSHTHRHTHTVQLVAVQVDVCAVAVYANVTLVLSVYDLHLNKSDL